MTATTTLKPPPSDGYAHIVPLPTPPKAPDAMQQSPYVTRAYSILETYFHRRPDVLVGSDGYLCYDTTDRSRWVKPDCLVAFGVDPDAIFARNSYVISEVGKPPEFVLEVASESTGRQDYTRKRDIYAEYGVAEYWRFDRTGGQYHDRPLSGDHLVNGQYEPLPLDTGADGVIRGYSPVLGLELHWDTCQLRFYDPVAGDYLPDLADALAQRDAAEALVERLRAQLHRLQSD
ncbi:MAG: Uma2 family endonuclease [Chloroflexota bacterium]|nr:Uma2 family endonuclease [Chloroflexota bacterium]